VKPVKRLEIVVDQAELPRLVQVLDTGGVAGYTILREAQGMGRRGRRGGDGLSGEFSNGVVIIAAPDDEARRIVELVRPVLRMHGGICLMSEAQWVIH
jgi:nitrogen regulatory protein P-II 1